MIALCCFGKDTTNKTKILSEIEKKFRNSIIHLFSFEDCDKNISLWKTSLLKRDFEIRNNMEFDLCIGINSDALISFDDFILPEKIEDNRVYFTIGWFNHKRWRTCLDLRSFFCKSVEFDRMAELHESVKFMPADLPEEEKVFYHVKTLIFDPICSKHENSSLFIRSA